jgi:hypothetical protein
MFQLIFVIFVGIGAIAAIRRNPSYTTHSLLRSVPVILLAIGFIVGLIIAAVHFTTGRSSAVIIATMVATILFGCFFLIYVIYTVSTPKDARLTNTLPPGTKLVYLHRRKVYHWAKIAAAAVILLAPLKFVLPGNFGFAALFLGAFILFIAALLLPILYFTSRMMDVSLTALQADPWLHWTYTPEQWARWSEVQATRLEAVPPAFILKRDWKKSALFFLAVAAGVYIFCPGGYLWKTIYIAAIIALMVAIGISAARGTKSAPAKLRTKLLAAPPEVYFGRDGLFANGDYTLWRSTDTFLNAAAIDDRAPRSLMFHFEKDVPNPYGPLNVVPINEAVLILTTHEHDLTTLQQKLADRCPQAHITLT